MESETESAEERPRTKTEDEKGRPYRRLEVHLEGSVDVVLSKGCNESEGIVLSDPLAEKRMRADTAGEHTIGTMVGTGEDLNVGFQEPREVEAAEDGL